MMTKEEVYTFLCSYDQRSPDAYMFEEDDTTREPRKNCYCDNCFSGVDHLALEILRLMEKER
jgi:hypothetical protein